MYFLHTESTWIVENDDSMSWFVGLGQSNRKIESQVDVTVKDIEVIV